MRRLQRVAATAAVTVVLLAATTGPAAADHNPGHEWRVTEGYVGENLIGARAGAYGGRAGPVYSCNWERVWPDNTSFLGSIRATIGRILETFTPFNGVFSEYFDQDEIREIDSDRAVEIREEADEAGERVRIVRALPDIVAGNDVFLQIENGKTGFLEQFFLFLQGRPDLGQRIDGLSQLQADGDIDALRASYPLVQRGETTDGGELWWDPFYVGGSAVDEANGCPAMVFYSPREREPAILLPDVLSEVVSLLPPAQAVMAPIDKYNDWAYVQVPTNFGVEDASLERRIAHAQVEYIDPSAASTSVLWAQVTADPVAIVFHPGGGLDPVSCPVRDMRFVPDDPGPCSFTYLDSSNTQPGRVYRAEVEVIWVGRYTSSEGADQNLGIIATTSQTYDLPVAEARAAATVSGR